MNSSSLFGLYKPVDTDNADLGTWISGNAESLENVSKHNIALQTNTSGTAYLSDFLLVAYVSGHSFVFIPTITSTGAVTINFNSLGVKNIYDIAGTTQLNSSDLKAYNAYLLIYDSTINGGIGGFKSNSISERPHKFITVDYNESVAADGTVSKTISIPTGWERISVSANYSNYYYNAEIYSNGYSKSMFNYQNASNYPDAGGYIDNLILPTDSDTSFECVFGRLGLTGIVTTTNSITFSFDNPDSVINNLMVKIRLEVW